MAVQQRASSPRPLKMFNVRLRLTAALWGGFSKPRQAHLTAASRSNGRSVDYRATHLQDWLGKLPGRDDGLPRNVPPHPPTRQEKPSQEDRAREAPLGAGGGVCPEVKDDQAVDYRLAVLVE